MGTEIIIIISKVFSVIMVLVSIFMFINLININKTTSKKELLNKMLKNKDITPDIYIKYLDKGKY